MGAKRCALLIGIQSYKILSKLDYCEQDALAMEEALREYNCQFSCSVLLEQNVSTFALRHEFKQLFQDADTDAVLLFFFAGHAVTIAGSTYLITLDTEHDIESCISFDWIIRTVQHFRKEEQSCIFLLDCCHAGSLPLEEISVSIDTITNSLTSTAGVTLIAATEASSTAQESAKLKQGIFTHWLFNGLLGGAANANGEITPSSLHEFVAKNIEQFHQKQKVVYKTTMIGKPVIIGDGFLPQSHIQPSTLSDAQYQEIEIVIRQSLDKVRVKLDSDFRAWQTSGHRETSRLLSELINWRIGLENKHPVLRSDPAFRRFDGEILNCQSRLTSLQPETVVQEGIVKYELGSGGFGTVYAVETAHGSRAYKVYHANQLHEREKVKAFMRGYRAMKKLEHPNIVKVFEETNAPLGFYMDYINGQNFRNWWTGEPEKFITILHVVAQTVGYAHTVGVVHRDIKPENIIIDDTNSEQPIPYLTDFDLAWYSMATMYSTVTSNAAAAFGHYLYAAPEQYERPGDEITRKPFSDIYGFGQLCYFAILGTDPLTDKQISLAALKDRLESWQSAEAAQKFLKLYDTCTKRRPSDRYKSMTEVSAALLEIRDLLIDPDHTKQLMSDQFVKELVFSIFGFQKEAVTRFLSRSTLTEIDLQSITHDKVNIRFSTVQGFVGMTGSFDQQRSTISKRIGNRINEIHSELGLEGISYKPTTGDIYSVNVTIPGNLLTYRGVNHCRSIILDIVSCIES